jgi:hypothetical protein
MSPKHLAPPQFALRQIVADQRSTENVASALWQKKSPAI